MLGTHDVMSRVYIVSVGLSLGFSSAPLVPNARLELRLEAGARHERTLEAVSSRPLFGRLAG
jgi:hypothetical protein